MVNYNIFTIYLQNFKDISLNVIKNANSTYNSDELTNLIESLTIENYKEVIEKIFALPNDILHPLLESHRAVSLKLDRFGQELFIEKLFTLTPDALQLILKKFGPDLLKSGYDNNSLIIKKLFALEEDTLQPILEVQGVDLLKASYYAQKLFIQELFALSPNLLQPILKKHGPELLHESGYNNSVLFVERFFTLPEDILQSIFEVQSLNLMKESYYAQELFIKKLFNLSPNLLQPILKKHGPELLHESGYNNSALFVERFFTLPEDILQSIFEVQYLTLMKESYYDQELFIKKFFNLSPNLLQPILQAQGVDLLNAINFTHQPQFIREFSKLPMEILKSIFDEQNIIKWLENYKIIYNKDCKLLLKDFLKNINQNDLNKIINTDYFITNHALAIIEFLPPALSLVDASVSLHPTVSKLLENTYFRIEEGSMDKKFLQTWIEGLHKIIELSPTLALILEKTNKIGSNIYITNKIIKSSTNDAYGTCNGNLDICIVVQGNINDTLGTFVHELTHKLIQMTYSNDMLPFDKDSNFIEMRSKLKAEIEYEQLARLQNNKNNTSKDQTPIFSWINELIYYSEEEIAVEILPHFTGHLASSLLDNNLKGGAVSFNFATIMWKYLHEQLKLDLPFQELPSLSYYDHIEIDIQDPIIKDAAKLLSEGNPDHTWLDSESGKLAFSAIEYKKKEEYLKKLFTLPQDDIIKILSTYLVPLIQFNENKFQSHLMYELNNLLPDIRNPIIIKNDIAQLTDILGESLNSYVKLWVFNMSSDELSHLIEANTPKFLENWEKELSEIIMSKLEDQSYISQFFSWVKSIGKCLISIFNFKFIEETSIEEKAPNENFTSDNDSDFSSGGNLLNNQTTICNDEIDINISGDTSL